MESKDFGLAEFRCGICNRHFTDATLHPCLAASMELRLTEDNFVLPYKYNHGRKSLYERFSANRKGKGGKKRSHEDSESAEDSNEDNSTSSEEGSKRHKQKKKRQRKRPKMSPFQSSMLAAINKQVSQSEKYQKKRLEILQELVTKDKSKKNADVG